MGPVSRVYAGAPGMCEPNRCDPDAFPGPFPGDDDRAAAPRGVPRPCLVERQLVVWIRSSAGA